MIESIELSAEDARKIVDTQEGHFADLKSKQIAPAKLSRTISAFANASGGELFLGISESTRTGKRIWDGYEKEEDANGCIALFEELYPLSTGLTLRFYTSPRKRGSVLCVQCPKTARLINASDGIPYVRRGAQNLPQKTQERIRALELAKGIHSFEDETIDIPLSRLTGSSILATFVGDVVPKVTPRKWLDRQLLVSNAKPIVAGILLYDEEPQAVIPKRSGVKIFRYKTTDSDGVTVIIGISTDFH